MSEFLKAWTFDCCLHFYLYSQFQLIIKSSYIQNKTRKSFTFGICKEKEIAREYYALFAILTTLENWCHFYLVISYEAASSDCYCFLFLTARKKHVTFRIFFFCSSYDLTILRWCHGQKKTMLSSFLLECIQEKKAIFLFLSH